MKDAIQVILFMVVVAGGLLFVLYQAILHTSSSEVTFNENNTVVCITHKPAGTWTKDIDKCINLKEVK